MKKGNRRNILFRYGVIVFAILLVSLRIVYKLVDNTVLSAEQWNLKAEKSLSHIDTIMPVRGEILAADGSVLATNMRVYNAFLDLRTPNFNEEKYTAAIPQLADSLAKHFPKRDKKQWAKYLQNALSKPKADRTRAFPIVTRVSLEESRLLKTFPFFCEKKQLTGFYVDYKMARVRPYGAMARRSIGAVGEDSIRKHPYGKFGLERALDSLLSGTPGYSKKVSLTNAIVDWTDQPPVDGYNVLTTIDIKMQDILETELNKVLDVCKAEWGTAVLLEVGTGDIKAIANLQHDPHGSGYIESENRAVQRVEPGSVVKTLAMMIALDEGRIPDLNRVYTTGPSFVYNRKHIKDCVKTDTLSLNRALEISSNIVMSKMILAAFGDNPAEFRQRIAERGFFEPYNSGIAEEVVPKISVLDNQVWSKLALANQAYGYATELSPLHTATLYNCIAGGGRFVRPRLVRGLRGNGVDTLYSINEASRRLCSEETARQLRGMLRKVVWGPRGTARHVVKSDKVEIAGKTGTANRIVNKQYVSGAQNSRLAFCGFFPYDNPRYTCMVLIAYPRETWMSPESTSGRVVKNVAEALYARGLLDNTSDYSRDVQKAGEYPTYYATTGNRTERFHTAFMGGGSKATLDKPAAVSSGVPGVVGLGLRDALAVLERAGYNVTFNGSGYVAGQLPLPGSAVAPGTKIELTLKE